MITYKASIKVRDARLVSIMNQILSVMFHRKLLILVLELLSQDLMEAVPNQTSKGRGPVLC